LEPYPTKSVTVQFVITGLVPVIHVDGRDKPGHDEEGRRIAMRCLTPGEVEELFGAEGFRVSFEHEEYRIALFLEPNARAQQTRIGCRPSGDTTGLPYSALALNQWLPPNRHRLLWIDHWEWLYPHLHWTFMAVRTGLGEMRSISQAPGHYFDPFPWDEQDQLRISPEQARQTDLLIGLTALVMVGRWDGWLVADGGTDRIEFWEGNLFFHSSKPLRIAEAENLITNAGWPRDLK
jgi:hypothetical protein